MEYTNLGNVKLTPKILKNSQTHISEKYNLPKIQLTLFFTVAQVQLKLKLKNLLVMELSK